MRRSQQQQQLEERDFYDLIPKKYFEEKNARRKIFSQDN